MEMYFIKATEKDCDEIMNIYRSAIGTEGCTWSSEYPNEEIMHNDLKRGDLYCIRYNNEIIGTISIDDDDAVKNLKCWSETLKPDAEISRIAVKQSYQNQGIARKLIAYSINELKKRGYKSVHFLVSKTNYKALNSYAKLNFIKCGESDLFNNEWFCYEKEI